MKATIRFLPALAVLAMTATQPAPAQEAASPPTLHFNVLRLHAGTDQPLHVAASDADGTISEIRVRLMEKAPGAASYSMVWEKSVFGQEKFVIGESPLAGLQVNAAAKKGGQSSTAPEYALSLSATDNEGNSTSDWVRLYVEEPDVPVILTDLSLLNEPIPEGDSRSLTFVQEDSAGDQNQLLVRLNGVQIAGQYGVQSQSVTVESPLSALQPGKHILSIAYKDSFDGRGIREVAMWIEITDDPAVEGTLFPLTAKSHVIDVDAAINRNNLIEEAFLWASDTLPASGKWPLIIYLHGGGEASNGIAGITLNNEQIAYHNASGHSVMRLYPATQGSFNVDELDAFLDHVIANYPIDVEQIHLMGHSMGAQNCVNWATNQGHRFSTMVTSAPYFLTTEKNGSVLNPRYADPARQNEAFYSLPYRAYHGVNDSWVSGSRLLVEELNKQGPQAAEFILLASTGHAGAKRRIWEPDIIDFQLSHADRYAAWKAHYDWDAGGTGLPGEDADGDGLKNVVEYLTGNNPTSRESDLPPMMGVLQVEGQQYFEFRYTENSSASDYALRVSCSEDLSNWGDPPASWQYLSEPLFDGNRDRVTYRRLSDGGALREFWRIEAVPNDSSSSQTNPKSSTDI
jgi:pimeloyl-ACP methyl ester carboxylesterase